MATPTDAAGLIDTDVLIDASRGFSPAIDFLRWQRLSGSSRISVVSGMELIAGCNHARDLASVQQFLSQHILLPVDGDTSNTAFELMKSFFLSHGLLIPDALIAATALANGLTLFTKNTRHFQMIPGLHVVRPY